MANSRLFNVYIKKGGGKHFHQLKNKRIENETIHVFNLLNMMAVQSKRYENKTCFINLFFIDSSYVFMFNT